METFKMKGWRSLLALNDTSVGLGREWLVHSKNCTALNNLEGIITRWTQDFASFLLKNKENWHKAQAKY